MFILADIFLRMVVSYRAIWLSGRFGGMKTLLSIAISDWLLTNGFMSKVVGNVNFTYTQHTILDHWYNSLEYLIAYQQGHLPPALQSGITENEFLERYKQRFGQSLTPELVEMLREYLAEGQQTAMLYDAAVIFDETWSVASSVTGSQRKALNGLMAYLRKRNLVVLMPSALPLHRSLSFFQVQRVLNLKPLIGLPLAVFHWRVNMGKVKDKGYFALRFPPYFEYYDTFNEPPPGVDRALIDLLVSEDSIRAADIAPAQQVELEDLEEVVQPSRVRR